MKKIFSCQQIYDSCNIYLQYINKKGKLACIKQYIYCLMLYLLSCENPSPRVHNKTLAPHPSWSLPYITHEVSTTKPRERCNMWVPVREPWPQTHLSVWATTMASSMAVSETCGALDIPSFSSGGPLDSKIPFTGGGGGRLWMRGLQPTGICTVYHI